MTTDNLPPLLPLPMGGVPRPALAAWVQANMRAAIAAHEAITAHEAAKSQPVSDFIAKQHRLPAEAERIIADNMSMEPKQ